MTGSGFRNLGALTKRKLSWRMVDYICMVPKHFHVYKQVPANHPDIEWSRNTLDHRQHYSSSTVDEDVAELQAN